MDLSINRVDRGGRTIMTLGGEIDVYTAPFVRERLDEAVREGRTNLVVDLTGVRFLDSTGLGVLVGRLKLTRSLGGSLRLVGTDARVLKVFAITGLDKVFEIYPTLAEALAGDDDPVDPEEQPHRQQGADGLEPRSPHGAAGPAPTGSSAAAAEHAATSAAPGDRGA